jgi:hypothetical protein
MIEVVVASETAAAKKVCAFRPDTADGAHA